MDPVTAILGGIRIWTTVKPVKLIRNHRRAKRGLPPLTDNEVSMPEVTKVILADGTETTRTEPLLPGRTSTKAGTLGLVSLPVLQILQEIAGATSFTWDDGLVMSAAFAQLVTFAMMYITARYSKSPTVGGLL